MDFFREEKSKTNVCDLKYQIKLNCTNNHQEHTKRDE